MVHVFYIFKDIVWLVQSSWFVHYCSIHQFYWVSNRWQSEFALWWFFVRKMLSQIGSFFSFDFFQCFFSFDFFEYTARLFWVVNALWICWQFWYLWLYVFEIFFFVLILNAIFRGTNFFRFSGLCVASKVILMCSLVSHSSSLLS